MCYITLDFGGHSTLEYKLINEPEYQTVCLIKCRFPIPNVDRPYIYLIPKVDLLAENAPYLLHGRPDNIANTITSDINPNTTLP